MAKRTIPLKVKRNIKNYLNILNKDKLPIQKVILFGSYAKGAQNKWSDIDLCVISPKFKNAWDALQYLWEKRTDHKTPVIEPIGFSPKDFADEDSLIHEIKRTGLEIKLKQLI
ncbi:MAG: nucleotidyltransferase domain-containing protein [Parcubacteria group bacterium]|nr:nucleotidyltransferase domain-containing protein [Parcubacteria group bacterium]